MFSTKKAAQYYFGITFAGLTIKPCNETEFRSWYEKNYELPYTKEAYEAATFIWNKYA